MLSFPLCLEDPFSIAKLTTFRSAENGDFSDLTIVCGNDTYQAHKIILCARSAFFAKAMRFPGKVYSFCKLEPNLCTN